MDFGKSGLEKTTKILQERNINQIAAHATETDSKNIFIYQKGDLKIAILGYIYGMNGLPIPKPWMIDLIDLKKIKSDVAIAKTQADFVIVALHFGNEYERFPNKWQKSTVKQIADYGADMIIGSHPHVLQTVDMVTSTDGRPVFVAYGLGNFYCGQRMHYTDAGVILKYTIEKNNGVAKLKSFSFVPTWVAEYKDKGKTQYKILPSKQFIDLYQQGKASFLSTANSNRLKATYQETIKHLTNKKIGFFESE
jgi:poly-gamma-glutamate synthesis protein (capsule biosynthesis protein)